MTTQPNAWDATRLEGEEMISHLSNTGEAMRFVARAQHAKLAAVLMPLLRDIRRGWYTYRDAATGDERVAGEVSLMQCLDQTHALVEAWGKEQL